MHRTTFLTLYDNGKSVNVIAKLADEPVEEVREYLRDRGVLLVGSDAGDESRATNFAYAERRQDAMSPAEVNPLLKAWGIGVAT